MDLLETIMETYNGGSEASRYPIYINETEKS